MFGAIVKKFMEEGDCKKKYLPYNWDSRCEPLENN